MSKTGTGTDPLVGDVLDGRYEVLQRLARGGMATVYRAWDRRLERIVAVKVMHEGLGDDADFVAKFDREARAAARLCDKSVVGIFDQGHDHGRPYIVMEFVEGSTLRTVITRDAPLSPLRALQLIEPVAAALAVAHDSGLVHRDVKPENVLISHRGAVKVADFGLARAVTNQTSTHTQGLLIGTVSYLPPELLTTGRAQTWSDVYSTGIMLFEMLTGTKPYTGEPPITVAYKHVNEDVPLPSEVLARRHPGQARRDPIPDYVDALVAACTRRNPQARPPDGRELLRRVRRVRRALERGVRSDDALAAMVFPAAALPWSVS
ncbi:MAG: protein kinase domain-containing protein, partial [Brooklawnia sp.]